MVAKKRKTKRVTLQKKYKIQKRTKEHHKRLKKGRLEGNYMGKKKDDNFIPNAWPYKEELLKEIKGAQERMEVAKTKQKEKRLDEMMKRRSGNTSMVIENESKALVLPSTSAVSFHDESDNVEDMAIEGKSQGLGQNSRRAYLRELRKVVESADVLLLVLDARDPLGTRSTAVEDMVLSNSRKKLVYVLNKADLVPREVLSGWLSYLRKLHPTVPFKCNTQAQKGNLGRAGGKVVNQHEGGLQTSQAVGAEELIGLLKNYCRIGDTKSIISVGIVGFPNVGKSSLINSMMRTRAVGVSATPGFTKISQEVILDKNIRLIDCPGIVFADGDSISTALRNCVNVEEMEDVITPIQAILDKCPQPYLMQLYSIPKFKAKDCMSFLALVAKVTGRLKKGGVPNIDATARGIIHDWNDGKIKFYCKPPVPAVVHGSSEVDTKILSEFSDEMDISALQPEDIRVLDAIEAAQIDGDSYVGVDAIAGQLEFQIGDTILPLSRAAVGGISQDSDMADNESECNTEIGVVSSSTSSKPKVAKGFLKDEVGPGVDLRKQQKRLKKKTVKEGRRGAGDKELPSAGAGEDYSFDSFQY